MGRNEIRPLSFAAQAIILAILLTPQNEQPPQPIYNPILSSEIKPPATQEHIDELLLHAKEPYQMLLERLRNGTRLIALGEQHRVDIMENFGHQFIRLAAQEGLISFISLEIYSDYQPDVDNYLDGYPMSPRLTQVYSFHHHGYRQILDVAREYNLSVICSDNRGGYRDELMSINTLIYMENNPHQSGIFYAGNAHITEPNDILAHVLGQDYFSVMQIETAQRNDTIADAASQLNINRAIGIDNLDDLTLGNARWGFFANSVYEYKNTVDAIVIHPSHNNG